MTKRKPIRGQLTVEATNEISKRILAKEEAWRAALGVPQGFLVPDKPLPATEEGLHARGRRDLGGA